MKRSCARRTLRAFLHALEHEVPRKNRVVGQFVSLIGFVPSGKVYGRVLKGEGTDSFGKGPLENAVPETSVHSQIVVPLPFF